jgi:type IV fimbrial biogenesis protein FimT
MKVRVTGRFRARLGAQRGLGARLAEYSLGIAARGVTLVELMVTVAVLAIISLVAAPAFTDIFTSYRLSGFATTFAASAQAARSEAIRANRKVTLCRSSDGATCATSGGWEAGWIVIQDANGDGTRASGEQLVETQPALPSGYLMRSNSADRLSFDVTGFSSDSAVFTLCRATPTVGTSQRRITISTTGRATVDTTTGTTCP